MSNNDLCEELSFHSIYANDRYILLDELFQIVQIELKNDLVIANIYTPLNYSNLKRSKSHVKRERDGMYFHIVNKKKIRFILDSDKTIDIDRKQDRLRIRLTGELQCKKKL